MKRLIALALLAFGLAAITPGQDVSRTSQVKEGKQVVQATASPTSLVFGDQVIQTISKPLLVTLTNNTGKPIEISKVDMSAEHGEDFVVDDSYGLDDCSAGTIEAGKSCNIRVAFFPLLVGERTSFLLIIYDDPDHPQKISLKGKGIEPTGVTSSRQVSDVSSNHNTGR